MCNSDPTLWTQPLGSASTNKRMVPLAYDQADLGGTRFATILYGFASSVSMTKANPQLRQIIGGTPFIA